MTSPLFRSPVALLIAAASLSILSVSPSEAASELVYTNARILAPVKGSSTTAGYAEVKNDSDQPVLLKVLDAKPFKSAETHETYEDAGRMGMRKIEQIEVPAHETFSLKPGGHHVMLFDATRALKTGEKILVRFTENGKTRSIPFKVEDRNEKADGDSSHGHHHH